MRVGLPTVDSPYLAYEAQGHYVALGYREGLTTRRTGTSHVAKRGRVTTFSRRSRKRMLEQTARLELADHVKSKSVIFITLTYGQKFPSAPQAKKHLFTLFKRIRRIDNQVSGIWRMEFQQRGAPHFHLILFNLSYLDKELLKNMWGDIIGKEYWDTSRPEPLPPFTRIEAVRNARKVMSYVAKYVAKNEDESNSGFNHLPYLTVDETLGRSWGVLNRKALPLGELVTIVLEATNHDINTVLWQYRRLMAKKWKFAASTGRFKGASLFVDTTSRWCFALLWCIREYCNDKSHSPIVHSNRTWITPLC